MRHGQPSTFRQPSVAWTIVSFITGRLTDWNVDTAAARDLRGWSARLYICQTPVFRLARPRDVLRDVRRYGSGGARGFLWLYGCLSAAAASAARRPANSSCHWSVCCCCSGLQDEFHSWPTGTSTRIYCQIMTSPMNKSARSETIRFDTIRLNSQMGSILRPCSC